MNAEHIEILADATAAALGLTLAPEHRPGVLRYLALAVQFAELIEAVPLSPQDETALHFTAVEPFTMATPN